MRPQALAFAEKRPGCSTAPAFVGEDLSTDGIPFEQALWS
jgi:hypothetical protein